MTKEPTVATGWPGTGDLVQFKGNLYVTENEACARGL
jgi:hypothetical protein